jgi:hypothetical protein
MWHFLFSHNDSTNSKRTQFNYFYGANWDSIDWPFPYLCPGVLFYFNFSNLTATKYINKTLLSPRATLPV